MFIIPFLPDKISEFYYREITYTKIATNNNAEDRNTRIEKVFKYVSKISHDPTEIYSLVDKNSFIDAIRGIGWCDQQAFLLMNLLNKLGIKKTRLRDVQAHTVAEVLVDGKWILVDPFAGIIFTDKNNAFIGSNSSLVAPVTINKNSTVGASSVITKNVKKNSLALTRSSQIEIKNYK